MAIFLEDFQVEKMDIFEKDFGLTLLSNLHEMSELSKYYEVD